MSCGGHSANNCNECPYNGAILVGKSWCNGDCHWIDEECIPKTVSPEVSSSSKGRKIVIFFQKTDFF